MEFFNVCGVRISTINLDTACEKISRWINEGKKRYICVAPVSTIVECQRDPDYLNIVNQAGMVTPDGMPLVWLGRWGGDKRIKRTYGPDLMLSLCALSQSKGYRHFFYGGTPQTCHLLERKLKTKFPQLEIVGWYSPSFIELPVNKQDSQSPDSIRRLGAGKEKLNNSVFTEERDEVLEEINRLKPDILWVGLGSPKQDYWMYHHRGKLEVPVMVGVGAAFDFLSGQKKQAPFWMQRTGLEWLFRFFCEPKRLWRRYLIGNTQFFYFLLRDFLKGKKTDE